MMSGGIVLLLVAAFVYVTGLTVADLQDIRRARETQRHPFALRRRARPTIAVRIHGNPEHTSLKHVGYRKLIFTDTTACDYILELDSRAQLPHGALHDAVFILQDNPQLGSVAVSSATVSPVSLLHLLEHYREYIGALSDKSRRGLGLPPRRHAYARLIRAQPATSRVNRAWHFAYSTAAHTATLCLSYAFVYSFFVAVSTHQTTLFAISLVGLSAFISYATFGMKHTSLTDKCVYIVLLPISIPYLLLLPWWRCLVLIKNILRTQYQRSRLALRTIRGA